MNGNFYFKSYQDGEVGKGIDLSVLPESNSRGANARTKMPQLADEPDSNHFSCVAVATQAVITITPHVNV